MAAVLTEALQADYWKPVQAGDLDNTDTMKVQRLISNKKSKFHKEAYALKHPMSPHAAAAKQQIEIEMDRIQQPSTNNDLVTEGAGGLLVPLNNTNYIADLIRLFDAEPVLVIRHYLGSINHTLLSIKYLESLDVSFGWVILNGPANPASEAAILRECPWPVMGRIPDARKLNRTFVTAQAEKIRKHL